MPSSDPTSVRAPRTLFPASVNAPNADVVPNSQLALRVTELARDRELHEPVHNRLMEAYWNPQDARLFTDRVFGVGWAINLFRAKEYMRATYESLMGGNLSASQRWRERTSRTSRTKAADNS